MTFYEYLQTDGYCWFDTGIIPDADTKIELKMVPLDRSSLPSSQRNWGGIIGAQNMDDDNSTFQIRCYNANNQFSVRVGNGTSANVGPAYTLNEIYTLSLDNTLFTYNDSVTRVWYDSMDTCNYTLYISAINNGETGSDWLNRRATPNIFYYVKVWKSGVLVANLVPANNNGSLGFYDNVSGTFRSNLGTGTPVMGPSLSSINISPASKIFPYSGDSVTVSVMCPNSWTAVADDGTWVTLSASAGTGDGNVVITIPSYTGNVVRENTVTFTDTSTGDIAIFSISQKKYSDGQPVYLGGIEISEMYLGTIPITEAYLGDINVFIG